MSVARKSELRRTIEFYLENKTLMKESGVKFPKEMLLHNIIWLWNILFCTVGAKICHGFKSSGMDEHLHLASVAGKALDLGGPEQGWPFLCEVFIALIVKCFLKHIICFIPSGQVEVPYPKS